MKTTTIPALLALLTLPASASVTIDWVTIGNAGNTADTSGYGAVSYNYRIAQNETTIGQYTEFLNAVAVTDTYQLYHTSMASNANIAGITRSGSSGSYIYSVIGSANRPITFVSWFDAARFSNWIQNGQQTGSGAALTAEAGAYTLNGATSGIFNKNVGATVWIPSEDEWYKAAYYDPTKNSGAGGYWLHANQSNSMTSNTIGVAGASNYYAGDYAVTQSSGYSSSQNYLTNVGAYGVNSDSYYGTNDQAGNVWEWNDAVVSGQARGLRGGAWGYNGSVLSSSTSFPHDPTVSDIYFGFRLASVPEPSSLLLTLIASGALPTRRSRRA